MFAIRPLSYNNKAPLTRPTWLFLLIYIYLFILKSWYRVQISAQRLFYIMVPCLKKRERGKTVRFKIRKHSVEGLETLEQPLVSKHSLVKVANLHLSTTFLWVVLYWYYKYLISKLLKATISCFTINHKSTFDNKNCQRTGPKFMALLTVSKESALT